MNNIRTEDEVRDDSKIILGFDKKEDKILQGATLELLHNSSL